MLLDLSRTHELFLGVVLSLSATVVGVSWCCCFPFYLDWPTTSSMLYIAIMLFVTPFRSMGLNLLGYLLHPSTAPCCLSACRHNGSARSSPTLFYRDAISALSHLVKQLLRFTHSQSHAFCGGNQNEKDTIISPRNDTSIPHKLVKMRRAHLRLVGNLALMVCLAE